MVVVGLVNTTNAPPAAGQGVLLTPAEVDAAIGMLGELERNRLTVELAPSRIGIGMIRVVTERNVEWYQEFCAEYGSRRSRPRQRAKWDTAIKRANTVRALERMIDSGRAVYEYDRRLLPYVRAEMEKWK